MEVKIRSITLGGKLGDAGFEQCRLALESISKTHPEISITINSFFETQWEEYLTYTKSIKGGDFYFHKGSPLTFYNENIYIGDLQPFLKWAQLKLRYFDHRSDYKKQSERNVMKVMKAGVISGNRGYVYMKIKLQGKTHQVVFELFQDLAPKSSLNFATLCEGKFKNEDNEIIGYKGSNVHRIVKGAYVQAGKMNIKGSKTIFGKEFEDESFATIHDHIGILGMAKKNGVAHTNECEFYVTTAAPLTFLDKKYVAFGRVIEGFEAFRAMQDLEIKNQRSETPVEIVKAGWLIEPLKPKVELEVKKPDVKVPTYEGKLRINVLKGTNIRCGDIGTELSEPLAFIYMDREVKIQTEMDKAVNPYWDCSRDIDIQIKGDDIPKLSVECRDRSKKDYFLGQAQLDLPKILQNPGKWAVDEDIILKDPEKKIPKEATKQLSGSVYIKICYIPKDTYISDIPAPNVTKYLGTLKVLLKQGDNWRMSSASPALKTKVKVFLDNREMYETSEGEPQNPKWDNIWDLEIDILTKAIPKMLLKCEEIEGEFLGEAEVDLPKILQNPLKWGVDEVIKLTDKENIIPKDAKYPLSGGISVKICYIPKGADRTGVIEPLQPKLAADADILRINLVKAENLWTVDKTKGSEINAVLKLGHAKVFQTHDIKNSMSPVWNYSKDIEIDIKAPTPKLTVECLNSDTFLGEVEIDLSKILGKPRTWVVDGAIKLEDPNKKIPATHKDKLSGTIHLQICYIPKGSDIPTLPKPTQAKDPPDLTEVDMLKINFVHGKDLMIGDATSSDPFATLQLGKKDLAATPAIKGTLNPIWEFSKVAKIAKDWENPPSLTLTCWDHDIMGDDFLGEASIDLDSILKQPNKWGLNEEIKLGDPNNRLKAKIDANKLGRILVQICYLPKGTDRSDFPSSPQVKEK